uniref:Uncharacterized protein n=1 Tax=Rhizophora mucronata TaxID=61149 RepID=A0A2P2QMV6_RHIMU
MHGRSYQRLSFKSGQSIMVHILASFKK